MQLKNILSLLLLLTFGFSYLVKLFILSRRNNIHADVLGRANKDAKIRAVEGFVRLATFAWLFVWVLEIFFEKALEKFDALWHHNAYTEYAGLFITTLGLLVFIIAMVHMKTSWRVGIDKQTKTSLITYGIYRFSRNPAFVGFDLMFIGLFITYTCFLTLLIMLANILAFHLLILQEERHLTLTFKEEYIDYKLKTPRYFLR